MTDKAKINLEEQDLQEIFGLFSSVTGEEKHRLFDSSDRLFFRNEELDEEYQLNQEKREFAIDAWRAVAYFLYRHGYTVFKNGQECDLLASSGYDQ
jgi:hypothetical protein